MAIDNNAIRNLGFVMLHAASKRQLIVGVQDGELGWTQMGLWAIWFSWFCDMHIFIPLNANSVDLAVELIYSVICSPIRRQLVDQGTYTLSVSESQCTWAMTNSPPNSNLRK